MSVEDELRKAVALVCTNPLNYATEDVFQTALAGALGNTQRELVMNFDPPPFRPKVPSTQDIAYCAKRGAILPPEGKDPCHGKSRRLDILWNDIAIELKSVTEVKADLYGYNFLRDLHRLERLNSVATGDALSNTRYAIFVSSASSCWQPATSNAPLVYDGLVIEPQYWVQYAQPSSRTRWLDYPPFYLAGSYKLEWSPLSHGAKYLLVPVLKAR